MRVTVRTGIRFATLAEIEGRDVGPLPFGEWLIHPWVIVHKGVLYGALYVHEFHGTDYYVDGVAVSRDTFVQYLPPSRRESRRPTGGRISPKLTGITLLGA
jgi:hypothetical protein